MVQRHFGRVVRDDAAGAQRRRVGVQPLEVVEPELRIEAARIVLDQGQLYPAHRPVEPPGHQLSRGRRRLRRLRRAVDGNQRQGCAVSEAGGCATGHAQKVTPGGVF